MFQLDGKELRESIDFVRTQWHRRSTLLVVLLFIAGVLLWLFSGITLEKISLAELLTLSLVLIIISTIWFFSRRVPKAPKGRVGFAVAISTDTKEQRERLAKDFIDTLQDILSKGNLKYHFFFVEFPEYYALRIKTKEDATKYLHISKCHFMIYGRARIRKIQDKDHHVLNLEGIVAHKPVPQEVSKRFSEEFAELFPQKLLVSSENDLLSFEFTSEWVNLVAKYIIGIASLLSGDVDYSQSLFEDLQQKIKNQMTNLPAITKIRQRLPVRLSDVYFAKARLAYGEWRQTKGLDEMSRVKQYLDKLKVVDPGNYGGHLLRAIWHFVTNRNVAAAKAEIRNCKSQREGTWRFSYAFLLAYEGKMDRAVRMYRSAFRSYCEERVFFEVEEFICWVLEVEPDKIQLHFCLGLLNCFAKGDKARALKDFEKFLETAPREQFIEQVRLAESYTSSIRQELRI